MRIRMLGTHQGSPDGRFVETYEKDRVYDGTTVPPMSDALGKIFVDDLRWAEPFSPFPELEAMREQIHRFEPLVVTPERKDAGAAPENKDAGAAPAGKKRRPRRKRG